VRCVSEEEKRRKPQIGHHPTIGARLLISLPVEQQLLELKPNGSKNWQHKCPDLVGPPGE
jgi:hypothetical protein